MNTYGTRRVDISSMARDRMTPSERADVQRTCRDRGLRLQLLFSVQQRAYVARLTAGSRTLEAADAKPYEAWRKALAQHDGVTIVSVLS